MIKNVDLRLQALDSNPTLEAISDGRSMSYVDYVK